MDKNMTLEQANNLLEETVKKLENSALPIMFGTLLRRGISL